MGICLSLNPNNVEEYKSFERLQITLGINESDNIGGWKGNVPGTLNFLTF